MCHCLNVHRGRAEPSAAAGMGLALFLESVKSGKQAALSGSLEGVCPDPLPSAAFPLSLFSFSQRSFALLSSQSYMQTMGREMRGGIVFLLTALQAGAVSGRQEHSAPAVTSITE